MPSFEPSSVSAFKTGVVEKKVDKAYKHLKTLTIYRDKFSYG